MPDTIVLLIGVTVALGLLSLFVIVSGKIFIILVKGVWQMIRVAVPVLVYMVLLTSMVLITYITFQFVVGSQIALLAVPGAAILSVYFLRNLSKNRQASYSSYSGTTAYTSSFDYEQTKGPHLGESFSDYTDRVIDDLERVSPAEKRRRLDNFNNALNEQMKTPEWKSAVNKATNFDASSIKWKK